MSRVIVAILLVSSVFVAVVNGQSSENDKCGKNEEWFPCGTPPLTDPTCTKPVYGIPPHIGGLGPACLPGMGFCLCKRGFVRDDSRNCINFSDCKTT